MPNFARFPSWHRTGRDDSFYFIGRTVGIGIPVWLGWVLLYLVVIFLAVAYANQLPVNLANRLAGSGPGILGLIDLVQRLRAHRYAVPSPSGLEIIHHANLIDRLTFRECGWYLPLLFAPLPLWLLGAVITISLVA